MKSPIAPKLLAISGTLALIVFMILGFAFDGWAYAWVAFLFPGMIRTWMAVDSPEKQAQPQQGYGITETGETKRYPHE